MGVAYPLLAHSRLGCSPEFAFHAAYHTTSCKFRSKTNQCPDKKSGGHPAFRPAVPLPRPSSPAPAAPAPVREGVAPRSWGISYDHGFPNRSIPEKD